MSHSRLIVLIGDYVLGKKTYNLIEIGVAEIANHFGLKALMTEKPQYWTHQSKGDCNKTKRRSAFILLKLIKAL